MVTQEKSNIDQVTAKTKNIVMTIRNKKRTDKGRPHHAQIKYIWTPQATVGAPGTAEVRGGTGRSGDESMKLKHLLK